jgi:DNA-binding response OmpR family regulator
MKRRILLVEDDLALRTGLVDSLVQEGYEVQSASEGQSGQELILTETFDLAILDLMMPGRSGLEILRKARESGLSLPILLLTARGDESDKVLGLELGADDYVTKPFSLRELLARIRAMLRREERHEQSEPSTPEMSLHQVGPCEIDLSAFELRRDGQSHLLSVKEAHMLQLLLSNRGQAISRNRFLEEVWGKQIVGNRTIDTHILNLRKKLEKDPAHPQHLLTVHGYGYKIS